MTLPTAPHPLPNPVRIIPAPDRVVNYENGDPLPEEGAQVAPTQWWVRRWLDGDIEILPETKRERKSA